MKKTPNLAYSIDGDFHSLQFLIPIINHFDTYIEGVLEIEPFESFSKNFSSAYWYTQYHLTLNKKVSIEDDLKGLFDEKNINVVWFCITDGKTFTIKCIDGERWILEKLAPNEKLNTLLNLSDQEKASR